MLPHIKDNKNSWTVVVENNSYQFDATHPEYTSLVECVRCGDAEDFLRIMTVGNAVEDWSEGKFSFRSGVLFFEGEQIANQPCERIVNMMKEGWDCKPMLRHLELLYKNVSRRAVQESYKWSSHKGLPIDKEGYMLGYKGVAIYSGPDFVDVHGRTVKDGDLVDKYTRKIRNNVGDTNSMPRRQVCDDHTLGCSAGLHVGTFEYASDWAGSSGKVLLVRFSPEDIVSVPSDCSCSKMRVSQYEIIGIAREILEEPVFTDCDEEEEDEVQQSYWLDDDDDDDYEDLL